MKKFLSVILALALVMSVMLVSCKKETAESLVNGAMEKTNAHDAVEAEMNMELVMSVMGMEMEMPIDMKIQAKDTKSEKPTTYTSMTMSFMGEDVSSEAYVEGDWVYSLTEGEGSKMSREEAEEDIGASAYSDILTEFPSEVFEGVEIVKNEDGTKTVEFTLTKEQLGEFYSELVDSFTETAGGDESTEVDISDAKVKITVKSGEIFEFVMSFDMIMSVMGIEATAECTIDCDYVKFDDDVVITPPEGYLDFPEY